MAIEKGDFVEMDFTGKLEDGTVFDTTKEDVAQDNKIFSPQKNYGPVKLVVGENHVVPGLDDQLVGKEVGNNYEIHVDVEDAFGKKSSDKLEMVSMREFKKQDVKPFVGLEVNIDDQPGTVRSVSGGRVVVDFNHPLAGKDLDYEIEIKKKIEEPGEKVEAALQLLQLPKEEITADGDEVTVKFTHHFPEDVVGKLKEEVDRLTGLDVQFKSPETDDEESPADEGSSEEDSGKGEEE